MFSAHGAGSGTGGVGLRSSPISHLSETMRALLDTSPVKAARAAYFSRSEQEVGGSGSQAEAKARLGNAGVSCLPCPLLPPLPCPSPPIL